MAEEIRIVRGVPTDEELAAIVGALLTRTAPASPVEPPVSRWAASGRPGLRLTDGRPTRVGPDGWRTSALPGG